MQDQLNMVEDLIRGFLKDNREGKKQLIEWFLNEVMDREAMDQIRAEWYERSEQRKAHRNGKRKRSLKTSDGDLTLEKPQIREFPFETQVFDRYSRVERAVESAILESYIQGVSTRRVKSIVETLGIRKVSPSYVSSLSSDLDQKVKEFLERPIEKEIRYMYVDATYIKVRQDSRYKSMALYIAAGVREDGYREILGARLYDSETEIDYESFFDDLKDRGLKGLDLVISDGHKGIREAVLRSFPGASWQFCHVHFIRNLMKKVSRKKWGSVSLIVKESLENPSLMPLAQQALIDNRMDRAAEMYERWSDSLYNYQSSPREHWIRIRTTNMMERLNYEVKRRTKKVGAFPSEKALIRLAGSILMDMNEEWITGRKYLRIEDLHDQ